MQRAAGTTFGHATHAPRQLRRHAAVSYRSAALFTQARFIQSNSNSILRLALRAAV